jgi:hypothetical protein
MPRDTQITMLNFMAPVHKYFLGVSTSDESYLHLPSASVPQYGSPSLSLRAMKNIQAEIVYSKTFSTVWCLTSAMHTSVIPKMLNITYLMISLYSTCTTHWAFNSGTKRLKQFWKNLTRFIFFYPLAL